MASYINAHFGNYANYVPQLLSLGTPTPSAQLAKAIYSSDIDALKALIGASPDLLSTPFSNGDLPLNVAVREKKFECVKELLSLGADPKQRDDQQLSAIDYAIMTKDDKLVADILGHFISADIDSVKALLQNDQNFNQVKAAEKEIVTFTSVDTANLIFLPLMHQAITLKNKEWLKSLLDQTPNIAGIRTIEGNSILHFAAASGDVDILNLCLSHAGSKDLINTLNNKGQTPLHYAAALDHFNLMQLLQENGANIKSEDMNKVTPFALLSVHSNEKNPLNISRREMFIFLSTTAYWATQFLPMHTLSLESYVLLSGLIGAGAALSDVMLYGANFKTWKGLLGNLALGAIMSTNSTLKFAYKAFNTAFFAKNMFDGLNSCWRNASLSVPKAMTKAVVAHAPEAMYIHDFVNDSVFPNVSHKEINPDELTPLQDFKINKTPICESYSHGELCLEKAWKGVQMCTDNQNSIECKNTKIEFNDFLLRDDFFAKRGMYKNFKGYEDYTNACTEDFESSECLKAEKNLIAETGKKILSCFDAKQIIGCANESLKACKRAFKKASLHLHPDKIINDPENIKAEKAKIYTDLREAMDVVEKCSA